MAEEVGGSKNGSFQNQAPSSSDQRRRASKGAERTTVPKHQHGDYPSELLSAAAMPRYALPLCLLSSVDRCWMTLGSEKNRFLLPPTSSAILSSGVGTY